MAGIWCLRMHGAAHANFIPKLGACRCTSVGPARKARRDAEMYTGHNLTKAQKLHVSCLIYEASIAL